MILVDTNLWPDAALQDIPQLSAAQAWLEATFNHQESMALPWSVVLAVLRISTQPRLMQHNPSAPPRRSNSSGDDWSFLWSRWCSQAQATGASCGC